MGIVLAVASTGAQMAKLGCFAGLILVRPQNYAEVNSPEINLLRKNMLSTVKRGAVIAGIFFTAGFAMEVVLEKSGYSM